MENSRLEKISEGHLDQLLAQTEDNMKVNVY